MEHQKERTVRLTPCSFGSNEHQNGDYMWQGLPLVIFAKITWNIKKNEQQGLPLVMLAKMT